MKTLTGRKAAFLRNPETGAFWNVRRGWRENRDEATCYNLGAAEKTAARWNQPVEIETAEWLPFTGEDQARYRHARAAGALPSEALISARTKGGGMRWRGIWKPERPYRCAGGGPLMLTDGLAATYTVEPAGECLPAGSRTAMTTGYYTSASRDNTYEPRVLFLGRRKGRGVVMLAGYEDREGCGFAFDPAPIYSDDDSVVLREKGRDAAHAAYSIAESAAEDACDYNEAWDAGRDAAAGLDDAHLAGTIGEYQDALRESESGAAVGRAAELLALMAEEKAEALETLVADAVTAWENTSAAQEAPFREGFTDNLSPDAWSAWRDWLQDTPLWAWAPEDLREPSP